MNARLQVEHPVTELVTGHRPRARAAADRRRRAADDDRAARRARGHAIEVRLNAEDPARDFAPSPGTRRRASGRRSGPASASTRTSRTAPRCRRTTTRCSRSSIVWGADRAARDRARGRALGELEIEGVPHHARARDRHHELRGFRDRLVFDVLPGRGRRLAARIEVVVIEVARTALGGIALDPEDPVPARPRGRRERRRREGWPALDVSLGDDGARRCRCR